jgi:hypothetical protein
MSVTTLSETRTFGRYLEYTRDRVLPGIISAAIDSQPGISVFAGKIANSMYDERGPSGAAAFTASIVRGSDPIGGPPGSPGSTLLTMTMGGPAPLRPSGMGSRTFA